MEQTYQSKGGHARWAGKTPEERRKIMTKISKKGNDAFKEKYVLVPRHTVVMIKEWLDKGSKQVLLSRQACEDLTSRL